MLAKCQWLLTVEESGPKGPRKKTELRARKTESSTDFILFEERVNL